VAVKAILSCIITVAPRAAAIANLFSIFGGGIGMACQRVYFQAPDLPKVGYRQQGGEKTGFRHPIMTTACHKKLVWGWLFEVSNSPPESVPLLFSAR